MKRRSPAPAQIAARLAPVVALFAGALLVDAAQADEPRTAGVSGLFDQRYCEIITVRRHLLSLHFTVYNTVGLNDCPASQWNAIDADRLATELDVSRVIKNGPRFWMLDGIVGMGESVAAHPVTLGGIEMTQRATIERSLLSAGLENDDYAPLEIKRDTVFVFKAGKPVFELTDPDGNVYMMQSFSQIVDAGLTLDSLATLGSRLKLPKGWRYSTRVLDSDYRLQADGVAYVIHDELKNTYQRRPR